MTTTTITRATTKYALSEIWHMRQDRKEATRAISEKVIETVISPSRDSLSVFFRNVPSKILYKTSELK
jgi:hypothetical protein